MSLVQITKSVGFEQVGDIVDYRGNLAEAIEREEVVVLTADPRVPVTSETVEETGEALPEEALPIEEAATPPVVEETPLPEASSDTPDVLAEEPVELLGTVEGAN